MSRILQPARPEEVGLSGAGLDRIDAYMRSLIDDGVLAGAATLVARQGRVARVTTQGLKDIASAEPVAADTIFRIFSMTKPVTATAMLMLHDEGRWSLDDPIAKHLPEFEGVKVLAGLDAGGRPLLEDAGHPPTLRELMTHTAGFAYGTGLSTSDADKLYHRAGVWKSKDLAEMMQRLAALPLAQQPGAGWRYGIGMDIQGALIERLSGLPLPVFFEERIFAPLGMVDTAFHTPPEKQARLATLYASGGGQPLAPTANPLSADHATPPALASGGGGLVSTLPDYARYAQMLLNGGTWNGKRLLSEAAVKLQITSHLPDWMLTKGFGIGHQQLRPGFSFGLNGVVFTDPAEAGVPVGRGTYHWDGAAGTWFWIDPENDLIFVGMIQLLSWASPPLQATTQTMLAEALL